MSSFIFNIGIKIGDIVFRFALKRKNEEPLDKCWHKIIGRFYWTILHLTPYGKEIWRAKK